MWHIRAEKTKAGTGIIRTEFGLKEGKRQVLTEEIKTGKNLGKRNATSAVVQAASEAEARWNKQKSRKGYGLTVDASAAVRAVSPMLAKVYKDEKHKVNWETAYAQPKLDGFRCLAHWSQASRAVKLLSRENQPLSALTHLRDVLAEVEFAMLADERFDTVIFDGELYCHGLPLNKISSACKRKSDLTAKIEYHVYDVVVPDWQFGDRSIFVRDFVQAAGSPFLKGVQTVKVRSEGELLHCQREFMEQGYEGAMLRHGVAPYEAGKRSSHLLKVKVFEDDEFLVVDYKPSRGKYEGVPVFVCQTQEGNHFDVLAPGDMEEKRAYGANAQRYVGKFLTVRYQYMTKTDEPVPFLPVAKCFAEHLNCTAVREASE